MVGIKLCVCVCVEGRVGVQECSRALRPLWSCANMHVLHARRPLAGSNQKSRFDFSIFLSSRWLHASTNMLTRRFKVVKAQAHAHLLYSRMAMTMHMMKTTASTGPTTQMRPSSSSMMGWGSMSADTAGSE